MSTIGQLFAYFAQTDLQRWSQMVGQGVTHSHFGTGTIVNVQQRAKYIPVVEVRFVSDKNPTPFNSDSFKTDRFVDLDIPAVFLEPFRAWRAQWEQEHALAQEKAEAFEKGKEALEALAKHYNVPVGKIITRQGPTTLAAILVKIDEGEQLNTDQLRALEAGDCANVAATYFYRQYRQSADPWQLVKACSFLRKAGKSAKALQVSAKVKYSSFADAKAHSALLTTVGGAHRDMSNIGLAKECADQAITLAPDSFHPHNLMGAILYAEGDIAKGYQHFQRALELGSNARVQDSEIRNVVETTTPENRQAIVEYLLAKDANRYGWAKVFVAANPLNPLVQPTRMKPRAADQER